MNIRQIACALALILPGPVLACEYLTHDFVLCSEGTPWATGTWENSGDSATLFVDGIGYEGYAGYIGHEQRTSLKGALDLWLRETAKGNRNSLLRDKFSTADLKIVRSIHTRTSKYRDPQVWAVMFAQAPDKSRLELVVMAPQDTPLEKIDGLSREFATLVRPRPAQEGN